MEGESGLTRNINEALHSSDIEVDQIQGASGFI